VPKIFRIVLMLWLGLLAGAFLVLGIAFALLSLVWSLLRGRKPALAIRFRNFRQGHHAPRTDIVDVQAHEVRPLLPGHGDGSLH